MKIDPSQRVMIIGGHLTPALALAQYFREHGINDLYWVGTKYVQTGDDTPSFEYEEVKKLNIPFIELRTGKLWRKWTFKTLFKAMYNLILIPIGSLQSLFIILKHRPALVIGFGGYLQLHLLMWANFLGKATAIHEQTIVAGTSNRSSQRFADKIFISWKETMNEFPEGKTILSGNPIRSFVLKPQEPDVKLFDNSKPTILVTGGNQGSNTINWRLLKFLPKLLEKANVIHQVGNSKSTSDLSKAKEFNEQLPLDLKSSYKFFSGNFSPDFAQYMQKSDLFLCRAGANTVTEILALQKRAILIPIPWSSQQEQLRNAQMVAQTGLGYIVKQYDAMPPEELFQAIELGLQRLGANQDFKGRDFDKAKADALKITKTDACEIITRELIKSLS